EQEELTNTFLLRALRGTEAAPARIQVRRKPDDIASIALQVAWMLSTFRKPAYALSLVNLDGVDYDGPQDAFSNMKRTEGALCHAQATAGLPPHTPISSNQEILF
ncbi:MAG: hypothetical protein M1813_009262, partial [Trichoglossum hirsutum]